MEAELRSVEAARKLFQEGVWADPGNRDVVFVFHAWAVLEAREKNHALARELFKSALRVDPRSDATWETWIRARWPARAFCAPLRPRPPGRRLAPPSATSPDTSSQLPQPSN